jgi:hypothetical protein
MVGLAAPFGSGQPGVTFSDRVGSQEGSEEDRQIKSQTGPTEDQARPCKGKGQTDDEESGCGEGRAKDGGSEQSVHEGARQAPQVAAAPNPGGSPGGTTGGLCVTARRGCRLDGEARRRRTPRARREDRNIRPAPVGKGKTSLELVSSDSRDPSSRAEAAEDSEAPSQRGVLSQEAARRVDRRRVARSRERVVTPRRLIRERLADG